MKRDYDVFISYRRDGGAETAKHLRDVLVGKKYRVFFDTDALTSGDFNRQLLEVIEKCDNFIIILSKGALDRCENGGDWVRQELACALRAGKNIIPILHKDFVFPEKLPADIDDVRNKSGISASTEFFDAMVDRVISYLKPKPWNVFSRRVLSLFIAAVALALAVVGICLYLRPRGFPSNAAERDILNESIAYVSLNMGNANLAYSYYDKVLADALLYFEESSGAPLRDVLWEEIFYYQDKIAEAEANITDLSDALSAKLTDTKTLETAEFSTMPTGLRLYLSDLSVRLDDVLMETTGLYNTNATNVQFIQILQELSDEEKEALYISLNQMFVSVKKESMRPFLIDQLPLMTSIYRTDYTWETDPDILQSRDNTLYNKMQQTEGRYGALVADLRLQLDRLKAEMEEK